MINQLLYSQCSCMDALSFFFDLNQLEGNLYFFLVRDPPKTVAELMEVFDRNQSTIYTALEKLVSHGVVQKTKRSRETRGYEYIYSSISPKQVKSLLKERLDKLYSLISSCLDSFDNDALTLELNWE